MAEWTYVRVAYGLTWIVLAVYAVYLLRRQAKARARLDGMES